MRPKASQDIAEARDKGDLSENAEYDAAKEAQGMLEMRIAKLEEVHSNARLIDETHLDVSKVLVLSNVKIKNQTISLMLLKSMEYKKYHQIKNYLQKPDVKYPHCNKLLRKAKVRIIHQGRVQIKPHNLGD
jgi:transcription elongation GreA/GreB family factor